MTTPRNDDAEWVAKMQAQEALHNGLPDATAEDLAAGLATKQDAATAATDAELLATATTAQTVDQAGVAYTLALTDAGKIVRCTNAAAVVVTVPANADVPFPVGTIINVYATGAGGVTIAAAAGVTIRNNANAMTQYGEVSLRKDAANEWVRTG